MKPYSWAKMRFIEAVAAEVARPAENFEISEARESLLFSAACAAENQNYLRRSATSDFSAACAAENVLGGL